MSAPIVAGGMTHIFAKPKEIDPNGGYVVRRSRAIDTVGSTLRTAFGDGNALPSDIARCLEVLDRIPFRH